MKNTELNINELKNVLRHIILSNQTLQEKGKDPISIEVLGESGIGKTSTILDLAKELNLNYVKLNLAQIEEIGDLVGYPIRQFEMAKNVGTEEKPKWIFKWADEHILDEFKQKGYSATGKNQMGYCAPEWISNKEEGAILLIDDWSRADK